VFFYEEVTMPFDKEVLGEVFGTNFTRCENCSIRLRPFRPNEVQIGFDLEPFATPADEERAMNGFAEVFRPYREAGNICIHHPRVWIRVTPDERSRLGQALREKGNAVASARIQILADIMLEEGHFHPSQLKKLKREDL
jgi:hypothetical protein